MFLYDSKGNLDFYQMPGKTFAELFSGYKEGHEMAPELKLEVTNKNDLNAETATDEKLREYLYRALLYDPFYRGDMIKIMEAYERFILLDKDMISRIIQELYEELYYERELSEESEELLSDAGAFERISKELNAWNIETMCKELVFRMMDDPNIRIQEQTNERVGIPYSALEDFKEKYKKNFAIKK